MLRFTKFDVFLSIMTQVHSYVWASANSSKGEGQNAVQMPWGTVKNEGKFFESKLLQKLF